MQRRYVSINKHSKHVLMSETLAISGCVPKLARPYVRSSRIFISCPDCDAINRSLE